MVQQMSTPIYSLVTKFINKLFIENFEKKLKFENQFDHQILMKIKSLLTEQMKNDILKMNKVLDQKINQTTTN